MTLHTLFYSIKYQIKAKIHRKINTQNIHQYYENLYLLDGNHQKWFDIYFDFITIIFYMEALGFQIYSAASHQGAIEIFQLHF